MSAGMEPAGSPVTEDGDFSSPDTPRGTVGPKSRPKSKPQCYTEIARPEHIEIGRAIIKQK